MHSSVNKAFHRQSFSKIPPLLFQLQNREGIDIFQMVHLIKDKLENCKHWNIGDTDG